jgi:hypothetical protein
LGEVVPCNGGIILGKRKKKWRSAGSAISPIDKRGIKLATLATEAGLIAEAASMSRYFESNPAGAINGFIKNILSFKTPSGKLVWLGVGLKLVGKFVPQTRYMGVIGLR